MSKIIAHFPLAGYLLSVLDNRAPPAFDWVRVAQEALEDDNLGSEVGVD